MPNDPAPLVRYVEKAWAFQVRDEPAYPGDSMMEVVWTPEEAEAQRQRGYYGYALYVAEVPHG